MQNRGLLSTMRMGGTDQLPAAYRAQISRVSQRKGRRRAATLTLAAACMSGVASIFLSMYYLADFPVLTVVLPWQFPLWAQFPVFATGILLFATVLLNPSVFWPVLVATSIFSAGPLVLRFAIFDEWLVGCLVSGAFAAVAVGSVPRRKPPLHRAWVSLFLGFGGYLFVMSVVGFVAYDNPKALRFSALFLVIVILGYLLARYDFPVPQPERITLLVATVGLAYFALYVVHGVVFYSAVVIQMWEGMGWAGAGNQIAPGIAAVPAALILIGRERGRRKALGWAVLILALSVSYLADARSGIVIILVSMLMALFAYGFKLFLKIVVVGIVVSVLAGSFLNRPLIGLEELEDTFSATEVSSGSKRWYYYGAGRFVVTAKGDAGRFLYARGAVEALRQNPYYALTGAGIYGYFPFAGPSYRQVAREYGVPTFDINYAVALGRTVEPPRPPTLGVLIAETGLIGMALLGLCSMALIRATVFGTSRLYRLKFLRRQNLLMLAPLFLTLAWTYFASGALDMMQLYVILMPFGLVHAWSRRTGEGNLSR